MNQEKKTVLDKQINDNYNNVTGMVVLKDGQPVYENYFNGYKASNAVHVYSVTKSIFSALIGIAIDKGLIRSVDQKVLEFFPDYTVAEGEKTIQDVTVRELLTMTAPYKFEQEPYETFFSSPDWVNTALDFLGGEEHTGTFRYSPIIGTHILSGILANVAGQSILDFANENLFSPLKIKVPGPVILRNREEHMRVMNDKNTSGWVVDPQGRNTASWGLFLTPVAMAKFGQLYLDDGLYEGKRLISAQWIGESIREHSRWNQLPYGYLWWIVNTEEHSFAAMGDGGNVIYVNGSQNLVVSVASLFIPNPKDRIEFIKGFVEPLFKNTDRDK
ncbi:MAG TPA: serine hydrolase [Thermotogota bacterium]|nr:serine hydrolase [Thermotogota bacterium]